jgi:hypothetical protein
MPSTDGRRAAGDGRSISCAMADGPWQRTSCAGARARLGAADPLAALPRARQQLGSRRVAPARRAPLLVEARRGREATSSSPYASTAERAARAGGRTIIVNGTTRRNKLPIFRGSESLS